MTLVLPTTDYFSTQRNHNLNPRGRDASKTGYQDDHWVWDQTDCSPEVKLSTNQRAVFFHTDPVEGSQGSAGVRGTKGFLSGEHYWEVRFLEPPCGTSVMLGVTTKKAVLHTTNYSFTNLIGSDGEGWGLSYKGRLWHGGQSQSYCPAFYDEHTVIGVYLNLYSGQMSFYKNGESLGVAFSGLNKLGVELYPTVASTSENTEVEVEKRCARYLSLQEKCFHTVARQIRCQDDIQNLPLPSVFKKYLHTIK